MDALHAHHCFALKIVCGSCHLLPTIHYCLITKTIYIKYLHQMSVMCVYLGRLRSFENMFAEFSPFEIKEFFHREDLTICMICE